MGKRTAEIYQALDWTSLYDLVKVHIHAIRMKDRESISTKKEIGDVIYMFVSSSEADSINVSSNYIV